MNNHAYDLLMSSICFNHAHLIESGKPATPVFGILKLSGLVGMEKNMSHLPEWRKSRLDRHFRSRN
jgi:hypothetical protein